VNGRLGGFKLTTAQLGTLKKVSIRDVWKYEDADFTPWLAQSENIAKLAEAIGMGMEHPGNKDKVISLEKQADLLDRSRWTEYLDWLTNQVATFKKVFEPRVKRLDLPQVVINDSELVGQ
jgi:hypothetical protein